METRRTPGGTETPTGTESATGGLDRGPAVSVRTLSRVFKQSLDERAYHVRILALLALAYTAYVARPIILPVVLAILLGFVVTPIVNIVRRATRAPRWLAAFVVLLVLTGGIAAGVIVLARPAVGWASGAPERLQQLQSRLARLIEPVTEVNEAVQQVEEAVSPGDEETQRVAFEEDSFRSRALEWLRATIVSGAVTVTLLFFLLATGDRFTRKFVTILPDFSEKKRFITVVKLIRQEVSRYLFTISAINVLLGCAIAIVMFALGMPNPVLWGAMAAIFNFVPYLGALAGVVIVGVVAITTFDSTVAALAAPLSYLVLTALEGGIITPAALGRRFALSPVAVFIAIIFWGWYWGMPGALLAVPLLATIKIVCDNYEPLTNVGVLLGR